MPWCWFGGSRDPNQRQSRETDLGSKTKQPPTERIRAPRDVGDVGTMRPISQLPVITPDFANKFNGLTLNAGCGLPDTGAQDGAGGEEAFRRHEAVLAKIGLCIVKADGVDLAGSCSGIGSCQTLGAYEVPVGIGGINGIARITKLKEQEGQRIPMLVPVGLMRSMGSKINLSDKPQR